MCKDSNDFLNPALTVVPAVFGMWQCKISGLRGFPFKLMVVLLYAILGQTAKGSSQSRIASTRTMKDAVVFFDERPDAGCKR